MASVQLIVIVLYFALTVAVGLLAARRSKTASDFHGAEMGLFAIVCASTGGRNGDERRRGIRLPVRPFRRVVHDRKRRRSYVSGAVLCKAIPQP